MTNFKIVVTAGDQVALDDFVHLLRRLLEPGEVDLAVVLQRDFREDRQRLPSFATSICAE